MGTLYVVATPIGNLNDLSSRALDILNSVDLIACEDTRNTVKILNHFNIKTHMTAYHKFNEKSKSNSIITDLLNGKDVALVSDAGTPCVSDPGYELVKEARLNNIEVIGIPGCSASVCALSVSGLNSENFVFMGFIPTDNKGFKNYINTIKESSFKTFIIYESPKRLVRSIEILKDEFKDSLIYIASDLTKVHERGFYGPIYEVYNVIKNDTNIEKGEYVIILEKKDNVIEIENETLPSIESLLVDTMVKENVSIKDAVKIVNDKYKNIKKNDIYDASLNLKNIVNQRK